MLIYLDIGMAPQPKGVSLKAAAKAVGISAVTLRRWLLEGKVAEVARDRNNWRVFTVADIKRIRSFTEKTTLPESHR